jgi:transcriptional regulator with XRE-family HTH domain
MEKVIQAVGQRIKELRLQKNLTLEELAERSGCTPGFLSQVERNRAVPSISLLYAIAEGLDTRVSNFFPETIQTRAHKGEEFGYVLQGVLRLWYGEAFHDLYPGDSVHFRSTIQHRLENRGDQPAIALWLITPVIF